MKKSETKPFYCWTKDSKEIMCKEQCQGCSNDVLSEIEPDNEKPMESKSVEIIKKHLKEQGSSIFNEPIWEDIVDAVNKALQSSPYEDLDNEKPYLFYEGEKYYFGEEYEFSTDGENWKKKILKSFDNELHTPFVDDNYVYSYIRKIDHTAKYKKLFLELKEQAEKDGVNLKELI